jgi:RHS repeat-associated protein
MSEFDDPNGAIVARYEYDPYGNVTAKSGSYADANPFRFSTKYFDAETGLSYFGGRYYNAGLGRWLNRDPLDELGGVNLYAYVGNDPLDRVDPLGEMWCGREQGCYLAGGQNEGNTNCPRKGQSQPTTKPRPKPRQRSCVDEYADDVELANEDHESCQKHATRGCTERCSKCEGDWQKVCWNNCVTNRENECTWRLAQDLWEAERDYNACKGQPPPPTPPPPRPDPIPLPPCAQEKKRPPSQPAPAG